MKYFIVIPFIALLYLSASSQVMQKADSLKQLLPTASTDSAEIFLLQQLVEIFQLNDASIAIDYASQALKLSNNLKNEKLIGHSYHDLLKANAHYGNFETAELYADSALPYFEKIKSLQPELGFFYNSLGYIYDGKGEYDKALKAYLQALEIHQNYNNFNGIAGSYNDIAVIYAYLENYERAHEFYREAVKMDLQNKNEDGVAFGYNNIGVVYFYQDQIDSALSYFMKSYILRKRLNNDLLNLSSTINNISASYKILENYEKAVIFQREALAIREKINDRYGISNSCINLAVTLLKLNKYEDAKKYIIKGLEIAKKINAKNLIKNCYKLYGNFYRQQNDYKNAYKYQALYMQYKDTLINDEKNKLLVEMQTKYETEKQEREITLLTKDKKLKEEQLQKNRIMLISLSAGIGLFVLFTFLLYNRFRIIRRQKFIIEKQKHTVEEKNKEVADSINYAKRIQEAILPSKSVLKTNLQDGFLLFKPKDIVSGDFYWLEAPFDSPKGGGQTPLPLGGAKGGLVYFAVADCTGHGVPGAMVSVVCSNSLSKALLEEGITEPGKLLDRTRELVIERFEKSEEEVKDGMDIALCKLEVRPRVAKSFNGGTSRKSEVILCLEYAGANNPLWIINPNRSEWPENSLPFWEDSGGAEIKADKQPIGKYAGETRFVNHQIQLQKGDTIYLFSDGYPDQFGGKQGKKFKTKAFKKLLLSIQDKSMEEQKQIIDQTFEEWKGDLEQVDDVCIIGVRV